MKSRWIITAGLCAILGLSCREKQEDVYQQITRPVRVVPVESLGVMEKIYTGTVEAEKYSKLSFSIAGPLVEMNVDAGQKVSKSAIIAAIDPLDYDLKYQANKAAYITVKLQMERNERLLAMQAISKQEYEMAEADFISARSAYETSRNALENTRLRAPFEGFVEEKYVENYQRVQPGEPIVKLVDPAHLEVNFILPETDVRLVRERMNIAVEFDIYKGKWFEAKIKEFVDASLEGAGIPVRLTITDSTFNRIRNQIYPGFSCKIRLKISRPGDHGYSVPLSAVFKDLKTEEISVWLYEERSGTVRRRKIEVGHLLGMASIWVTSGLRDREVIVVDGTNYITNGQEVTVIK